MMAEYVAQMATRVVRPDGNVTSAFRKFILQVLTSTRLPSTTILLGMNYLAKRMNALKNQHRQYSEGHCWRFTTVALLLGSKFLDDNTFQNKSWSDVSGIGVKELNDLERDWVISMEWRLYVNLDKQKDFQAWLASWKDWARNRQAAQPAIASPAIQSRERVALQPLHTGVSSRLNSRSPTYSAFSGAPSARVEYAVKRREAPAIPHRAPEQTWPQGGRSWHQPITPPDSGYGTPDYSMNATAGNNYMDWRQFQNVHSGYQPPHASYYPTRQSTYSNPYGYNAIGAAHDPLECPCHLCSGPMCSGPMCSGPMKHQSAFYAPHASYQAVQC